MLDFNLEDLKTEQNYQDLFESAGKTVELRKPAKGEFFRVMKDKEYRLSSCNIINYDRRTYLVHTNMVDELSNDISVAALYTCVNRDGAWFFWAAKLPVGENPSLWNASAQEIALKATEEWLRMDADMELGQYRYTVPRNTSDPVPTPPKSFKDMLNMLPDNGLIKNDKHPVAKRLLGI